MALNTTLRRRAIRYQLLNAIAALDGTPEQQVGGWLADLGTSMLTGDELPVPHELENAARAAVIAHFRAAIDDDADDAPPGWPPLE